MPDIDTEIKNELNRINTEVDNAIKAVNEEVTKHGDIGNKNTQRLDTLSENITNITAQILELQQKSTSEQDVQDAVQSVGAEFTDSESFKNFVEGSTTKARVEIQNNLQIGDGTTVERDRRDGLIPLASRQLRIRDVMGSGTTTSNAIEYIQETLYNNNAAEKEEGDSPYVESDISFEPVNVPIKNIGHYIPITKQMMEDAAVVTSYINGRLAYGCEYRADIQSLLGNGNGPNLSGIFHEGNFTPLAGSAPGDDQYTNIRRAMAQIELAEYMANAVILNPLDCANIDLIKSTVDDHFISSNPRLQNTSTIWGLPVVKTTAMPQGRFLAGAFDLASQFTTRRGVVVEASESDDDNFKKDIVTLKATMRGCVEIYRIASLVGGDLITPP